MFLDRLDQLEARNLGPFPERFGYARSVQAALAGDSLRIPFAAWDAAVERAMQERRWASDFTPLLTVGKDLLLNGIFHQTQSVTWSFEGPMAISLPEQGPPQMFLGPTGTLRALAKGDTLVVQRTAGEYDVCQGALRGAQRPGGLGTFRMGSGEELCRLRHLFHSAQVTELGGGQRPLHHRAVSGSAARAIDGQSPCPPAR